MMKTGLTATAIAALIMGAIAFWAIQAMPETGQIPIHWNHKGIADGFTTPEKARKFVWLLPGTGIFTGLVMAIALKIDPRRKNIERSSRAYLAVWIAMLAIMTIISALICYSMIFSGDASSGSVNNAIPLVIVGTSSLLFLILGNYLPKTRSNWFFGIRTPWTLSSEEAWIKTHRIAGRLFIAMGLIGLLSIFVLPSAWQIGVLVGGSLCLTVFTLIYSYFAWRSASDRTSSPEYLE